MKKTLNEKKLWGGRFLKPTHELVERFTSSLSIDCRLAGCDIEGSVAHVRMLAKCGILTKEEEKLLLRGLEEVRTELESGKWTPDERLEDIHMNVETRLTEKIGEVGGKLHTARSRNDQVALDTRLYLRSELREIASRITALQKVLLTLAEDYFAVIVPGYTHLQQAQPVLLAHHFLAYVSMLERDKGRFSDALKRLNVLPLGAGALAGTSLPIDREYLAKLLGFSAVSENSIDTVSDRDDLLEVLSDCAILGMHLSRLSEELVLWSSSEFDFIELDESFCTGSSIMPQKKNPDVAELARGKTGRLYGNLVALLTVMKGLPLAYNRDLQEDKRSLFDSLDTVKEILSVFAPMLQGMKVNQDKIAGAVDSFSLATDLAEYLVRKGIPFRKAHEVVGGLVSATLLEGKKLTELSAHDLRGVSDQFGSDAAGLLNVKISVEGRKSAGGTAPVEVKKMIAVWKKRLKG